jgi:uncharacterized protein with PQ loop repeat
MNLGTILKILKVFKSSGKGVMGISKTAVGITIILLGYFGFPQLAEVLESQNAEAVQGTSQIIQGIGILLGVIGAVCKVLKAKSPD